MTINKNSKPSKGLLLATLGVVFGDIGTGPLYAIRECFSGSYGFHVQPNVVFGFLSLIFWMQILVVSVKYLIVVMRANNEGEGGILTLMFLAGLNTSKKVSALLVIVGLIGASFFYGEVVISPAIAVLSAVEGLEIIAPSLDVFVVPIAILIVTLLFVIQKYGTGSVGKLFGPIMVVWFIVLAILGARSIFHVPEVLNALNPLWAIRFFIDYKAMAFFSLGAVVLAITGVEALYTDMGHFGISPIRKSWFFIVLPALTLNYFGQGALLLANPDAVKNPFFLLAPEWALIPFIILATLATIVASQAAISGVFSLTSQAVRLGYLPPLKIIHTSDQEVGQIYIPSVNWILYISVVCVIASFQHSTNLTAAYGIALIAAMIFTGILLSVVALKNWHWNVVLVALMLLVMLSIDISLFMANLSKLFTRGWLPIGLGLIMFTIMMIWRSERQRLLTSSYQGGNSLEAFISSLEKTPPTRVSGTAVYMARMPDIVPFSLVYNLKHNKVLHERIFLLTVQTEKVPYVHNVRRVTIEQLSPTFWRIIAKYGYKETPNMEEIFHRCNMEGLPCSVLETSFFMSNEALTMGEGRPWYLKARGFIFMLLNRNSMQTTDLFQIPKGRTVVLGRQVKIE